MYTEESFTVMLIVCDSSFWYWLRNSLAENVQSLTPKFLTKIRELKEQFLKPEVKRYHSCLTEPREPDGAYLDSNKEKEMTMQSHEILF